MFLWNGRQNSKLTEWCGTNEAYHSNDKFLLVIKIKLKHRIENCFDEMVDETASWWNDKATMKFLIPLITFINIY